MEGAFTGEEIGLLLRAADYAAEMHVAQRRKGAGDTPYINHPLRVALILWEEGGVHDLAATAAAVLHDVVEDTPTTFADLEAMFGPEIAGLVAEVTDDKSLPKLQRKQAQIDRAAVSSKLAKAIKIADKISNLRDLVASPPEGWDAARKRGYLVWSRKVVAGMSGFHPLLDAAFAQASAAAEAVCPPLSTEAAATAEPEGYGIQPGDED